MDWPPGAITVSYTHLDVYKRQASVRPTVMANATLAALLAGVSGEAGRVRVPRRSRAATNPQANAADTACMTATNPKGRSGGAVPAATDQRPVSYTHLIDW